MDEAQRQEERDERRRMRQRGYRAKARATANGLDTPAAPGPGPAWDSTLLNFLEKAGVRGLGWVARGSITRRGYRLHQTYTPIGDMELGVRVQPTPRKAIEVAMEQAAIAKNRDR